MNQINTTLFTAEDVHTELKAIHERLDALAKLPTDSGSVVWASQATLAKRYDTSRSTICRILAEAVSTGKVQMIRPNNGVQKYHVAELDSYMVSISGTLTNSKP